MGEVQKNLSAFVAHADARVPADDRTGEGCTLLSYPWRNMMNKTARGKSSINGVSIDLRYRLASTQRTIDPWTRQQGVIDPTENAKAGDPQDLRDQHQLTIQ